MHAGDLIADRFELLAIAGEGGMGAVWRAHDRLENTHIALKVMLRAGGEEALRFAREASVMRQLSHPRIVRHVADGATPEGAPWIAMEWLEGEDLAATLARGPMAAGDALAVCIAVADALGAAHAMGLVHRDLKPANVYLVDGDPLQVKLLDFGVVRRLELGASMGRTRVGAMIGTPGYMSPEQARGDAQVDARADVFSLGCVLFECLTGRAVFSGEHLMALLAKVLLEEAPRLAALVGAPAELDELVARMLSKEAADRPADAAEVARAMRALGSVALTPVSAGAAPGSRLSSVSMSREQVWLCALVVDASPVSIDDATLLPETAAHELLAVSQAAETSGARLVGLAGGAQILLWEGVGSPADMATRAARAALSIQRAMRGVPLALASGRGAVDAAVPVGAALERAVGCVKLSVGQIVLDEGVARLLDVAFDVARTGGEITLRGERVREERVRTLLGKPTSCFGREVELATLNAALAEWSDDALATAVVVTGDAGVGKSRVRHEWVTSLRASHPEAQVWSAQGDVMGQGGTFTITAALVEDACGVGFGMPRDEVRRKIGAAVAGCVAAPEQKRVASRLCEMCGAGWEVDVDAALLHARREPIVMGDQLRAAWEDFLVASCMHSPVVLLVDDLQWADLPSVQLIDRALRNFGGSRWMVLAVGRPEHRERFPKLWAERGVREVQVSPLKARAAERLVRAALGATLAAERLAAIVERGAGNAYFLEELIRAESEGRGGEVPESVLAMVESRLLTLDPKWRRVLRAASVFGAQVDARGVSALLGGEAVWETLEALDRSELLAALPSGGYRFRQVTVREAAYAQLVDEDRTRGHAQAAAWLVSEGEKDAAKIAEHFERGGQRGQAATWWAGAAEQAIEGNDFATAITRAERAAALGAEGDPLARAMLAMAAAHAWRGEAKAQLDAAQVAAEVAGADADLRLRGTGLVASAAVRLGDMTLLVACVDRTLAALGRNPVSDAAVVVAAQVGANGLQAGQSSAVAALCEALDALSLDGLGRGPECRAWMMQLNAKRSLYGGDYESYLHGLQHAADAFLEAGDPRREASARADAGYALMLLGANDEAVAALRASCEEASRMGLAVVVATAQQNLGLALARIGAFSEAEQVERASVVAFVAGGNRHMEAGSRAYLARILRVAGRPRDAESEARHAATLLAPNHPMSVLASVALADALLARGDSAAHAEALTLAQAAYALLQANPDGVEEPAFVRRVYLDALEASGQHDAARVARDEARAWLLARAGRIAGAHYRHIFLHGDPDNAGIMGDANE